METGKIELSPSCWLVRYNWSSTDTEICLEYTEYSPDPWYGDSRTEVDITKEKAQEIIDFLQEYVNEDK